MLDVALNHTSRRDFLRVGTVAGLSLSSLLRAEAAAATPANGARAKSVLLVFLGGGLSHHDSFDTQAGRPHRNQRQIRAD